MERSSKRPRLSIFEQDPSGAELDTARHDNDVALKNRFESIFTKYSQDFTGIGDEVDIITGEVTVNNGHLESMQTETDPGLEHRYGEFSSAGRSILRAMTAALDPNLLGPDDVLTSIETIAENAAFSNDTTSGESEDDLFNTSGVVSRSMSKSSSEETEADRFQKSIEPYNSDSDSLFEEVTVRSGSVDSLFGDESDKQNGETHETRIPNSSVPPANPAADDNQILARFGPDLGREVLDLIGQRKQAHIEPMWRIPVQIETQQQIRYHTPTSPTYSALDTSPEGIRSRSLWCAPTTARRRVQSERYPMPKARAESVDPLQEDFVSEHEAGDISKHQSSEYNEQSDLECEAKDDVQDLLAGIASNGKCPYCHGDFKNKSGVMAHWDRLLVRPTKHPTGDDPHNEELIRSVRAKAHRRIRLPRLIVYDFRTMVELHEGAGMGFDDIVASKTLRSRKTSLKLQDIYNKHRTPPSHDDPFKVSRPWSEQEEERLEKLCQNPLSTIATLRRGLRGRDELEIGNHLADTWLAQLGTVHGRPETNGQPDRRNLPTVLNPVSTQQADHERSQEGDPFEVKREESEDELFAVS